MSLKFAIIQSVLFIFIEIQTQTEIPKYETYIKRDFMFKACPPPPWVNLRGWTEVKIQVSWNMDMLHIELKKIAHASNMVTLVNVNAPVVATTSWWLHFSAQVVV